MELLAVVQLESDTGVPADRVNFTLAFDQYAGEAPTQVELEALADAIIAAVNESPGGFLRNGTTAVTQSIANFLSPILDIGANRSQVRLYEIKGAGVPMGSPVFAKSFTLAAPTASMTAIPSEVAVAVTLEAAGREDAPVELGDGTRPKSRFTGRIYFGPVNTAAVGVLNGVARPSTTFQDVIINALVKLDADVAALSGTADLAVYSRADNTVRPVAFISCDDSFDTQRRRGESPTLRRRVAVAEA